MILNFDHSDERNTLPGCLAERWYRRKFSYVVFSDTPFRCLRLTVSKDVKYVPSLI